MKRALETFQGGISIGGKKLNNFKFVDDILLAKDKNELTEMLLHVIEENRTRSRNQPR